MVQVFLSLLFLLLTLGEVGATVAADNCKHNLSASNKLATPVIRATSEIQVCKFCHIPHGKQSNDSTLTSMTTTYSWYAYKYSDNSFNNKSFRLPLIGHQLTTSINAARVSFSSGPPDYLPGKPNEVRITTTSFYAYGPEGSIVFDDPDGFPDSGDETREIDWPSSGSSRVCFSCHDGTIQIGAVYNSTGGVSLIEMDIGAGQSGEIQKITADGYMGKDAERRYLPPGYDGTSWKFDFASRHSCEHGFYSFYMTQNVLDDPTANSRLMKDLTQIKASGVLDRDYFVQCTACHDPHKGGTGTSNDGKYTGGLRQFWRKPGEGSEQVCTDCHTP